MHKRIYLILFPILALLFSSQGKGDSLAYYGIKHAGYSITNISRQKHSAGSNLKRGESKDNKNAIRKKACHDSFALNIPDRFELVPKAVYYTKTVYGAYNIYLLHAHPSINSLRGPPAII